jgi:hypothetical protein
MRTIALLLAATALAGAQTTVGTFDRTRVLVAFHRSTTWKETLQAKKAERDRALQSGDRRAAVRLERWGRDQQELAHRQLERKGPLDNIFAVLQPRLQKLSHSAGVAEIREKAKPGEEAVDVTDRVLEVLK